MGQCPKEYRGNLCVHPSICPSVHLAVRRQSIHPPRALLWLADWIGGEGWKYGQMDRWMDRWTDGRAYAQIPPEFYRTSSPLGPQPKKDLHEFHNDSWFFNLTSLIALEHKSHESIHKSLEPVSNTPTLQCGRQFALLNQSTNYIDFLFLLVYLRVLLYFFRYRRLSQ